MTTGYKDFTNTQLSEEIERLHVLSMNLDNEGKHEESIEASQKMEDVTSILMGRFFDRKNKNVDF